MNGSPKVFVAVDNTRNEEQRRGMATMKERGLCPFCPEGLDLVPLNPPLRTGRHWILTTNRWPLDFTLHQLLAVHIDHAEHIWEVTGEAWAELFGMFGEFGRELGLESCAVGIRSGDPAGNGASIRHIHAHLIAADPDTSKPGYDRQVWFAMGPDPQKRKAPGL